MTALTTAVTNAVVATYDFSSFHTIVDVGGGNGTLMAAVLAAHPEARGIIFDLPHARDGTSAPLGRRPGETLRVRWR